MTESTLDIDGTRIRYKRAGAGPAVLLLHGWGGSIESFHPVFQALAPQFDVTAIDFPGHGQSSLPPSPWRVSDFLDCTLRVMDRLGLSAPHIVAHSFGGRVTIQLAARHPERVAKILFTAGAGVAPRPTLKRSIKRGLAGLARAVESVPGAGALVGPLRGAVGSKLASRDYANAGELRATLALVVAEDQTPLLSSIRSKCLMIWGENDTETPVYMGETMASAIAGSELVVLPGAGHFPYLDHTNKFNLLMLKFFRES